MAGMEPALLLGVLEQQPRPRAETGLRRDDGTPQGAVFIPFAYYEAAANLMTNAALDPVGKIPEFKYCAVAVAPGGELLPSAGYGTGSLPLSDRASPMR